MAGRLAQIVDLFYPGFCISCGARDAGGLCRRCFEEMLAAVPPTGEVGADGGRGRALCLVRAAGLYAGSLREMVLALKSGRRMYADPLARLMAAAAGNDPAFASPGVVVPVPSTRSKVSERGYNPAGLLARRVAGELQAPFAGILFKNRKTPDQDSVPAHVRRSNVRGAFSVLGKRAGGDAVLLVDDVLTTGATAEACALALLEGGAGSVNVLVAAKSEKSP